SVQGGRGTMLWTT
nr:immunoglobulin heavy chain junction region [Mus musculus]